MRAIAFDHKLTVAVPSEFGRALIEAAKLRGLSLPDLIRRELQGALVRERVPFRSFPDLERPAATPRNGSADVSERIEPMRSMMIAVACLAAMSAPARALTSMPPSPVACDQLATVRAQARSAATGQGYEALELDDDQARQFFRSQGLPDALLAEHATVFADPKTGHAVALLNDGSRCTFSTVVALDPQRLAPIETAIGILRNSR